MGDDVSEEHLYELSYYDKVVVSMERIEQNTKDQGDSDLWTAERRKRKTAPVVGGTAKMQKKTERSTRVIYVHCQQHGYSNLKTVKTGLVLSLDNPLLAVSPDKVHDPTAIPPYSLSTKTLTLLSS